MPPKHDAGTATRHYRAFCQRRCRAAAAGAVLKPQGGNCAVLPKAVHLAGNVALRLYQMLLNSSGPAKDRAVEIGYGILPSYEGNGYMTEGGSRHDPVGICAARCGFCGGGNRPGQPRIPAHIGKMRLCAKRENRGGRLPFCGGTTPNNLSVNSEKVLAGWAAIRQINLPVGKKSDMSAPFCSFTKGREKEYNLNNRHRKYTVRQTETHSSS